MNTTSHPFPLPVDKLLALGDCSKFREWPNYLELGLREEHITDLIRMATDEALHMADSESMEVWAPIHALRALGQLRAEAAIQPIIGLFNRTKASDNYAVAGFFRVMGMIGPTAIPALAAFIADQANKVYPRSYAGDWEDMQIELGLLEARTTEPQFSILGRLFQDGEQESDDDNDDDDTADEDIENDGSAIAPANYSQRKQQQRNLAAKKKLKNNRVMAAKSRQQNRKKKKEK